MSKSAASRRIEDIADVAVGDLRPHPDNPRKISRERLAQLKRSLEADPDLLRARPLIALRDGTVIAGNQRLRAAVELGWPSVPVVYADVDDQTARLWMLRDNNSFGDWDERPLAEMLAGLAEGGVELALAGFEGATVDGLLGALERERARPEPDDAPPLPSKPRSKPGEVYELGPHRLACGDATQALAALMGDDRAALVVTDPPYGVDIQERDMAQAEVRGRRKDGKGVLNDNLTGDALAEFLAAVFTAAMAVTAPGAGWYVFAPSGVDYRHFLNALADLGVARHGLVWVKDRFVMGRADYHYRHENVVYGWTPGGPHQKLDRRDVDSVLEYPRPGASPEHPTMKPVDLLADLIGRSSRPGAIVLDPFAGSGSTMIAADRLGRRAFMVELDPGYCDVIRDRWEAWNADQV